MKSLSDITKISIKLGRSFIANTSSASYSSDFNKSRSDLDVSQREIEVTEREVTQNDTTKQDITQSSVTQTQKDFTEQDRTQSRVTEQEALDTKKDPSVQREASIESRIEDEVDNIPDQLQGEYTNILGDEYKPYHDPLDFGDIEPIEKHHDDPNQGLVDEMEELFGGIDANKIAKDYYENCHEIPYQEKIIIEDAVKNALSKDVKPELEKVFQNVFDGEKRLDISSQIEDVEIIMERAKECEYLMNEAEKYQNDMISGGKNNLKLLATKKEEFAKMLRDYLPTTVGVLASASGPGVANIVLGFTFSAYMKQYGNDKFYNDLAAVLVDKVGLRDAGTIGSQLWKLYVVVGAYISYETIKNLHKNDVKNNVKEAQDYDKSFSRHKKDLEQCFINKKSKGYLNEGVLKQLRDEWQENKGAGLGLLNTDYEETKKKLGENFKSKKALFEEVTCYLNYKGAQAKCGSSDERKIRAQMVADGKRDREVDNIVTEFNKYRAIINKEGRPEEKLKEHFRYQKQLVDEIALISKDLDDLSKKADTVDHMSSMIKKRNDFKKKLDYIKENYQRIQGSELLFSIFGSEETESYAPSHFIKKSEKKLHEMDKEIEITWQRVFDNEAKFEKYNEPKRTWTLMTPDDYTPKNDGSACNIF